MVTISVLREVFSYCFPLLICYIARIFRWDIFYGLHRHRLSFFKSWIQLLSIWGMDSLKQLLQRVPKLPCWFHTNIFAVVFVKPLCKLPKVLCISGKPLGLVRGNIPVVCWCDERNRKGFVYINTATDRVGNFQQGLISLLVNFGNCALTGRSSINEYCLTNFSLRASGDFTFATLICAWKSDQHILKCGRFYPGPLTSPCCVVYPVRP